jgi:hypothetical protein
LGPLGLDWWLHSGLVSAGFGIVWLPVKIKENDDGASFSVVSLSNASFLQLPFS